MTISNVIRIQQAPAISITTTLTVVAPTSGTVQNSDCTSTSNLKTLSNSNSALALGSSFGSVLVFAIILIVGFLLYRVQIQRRKLVQTSDYNASSPVLPIAQPLTNPSGTNKSPPHRVSASPTIYTPNDIYFEHAAAPLSPNLKSFEESVHSGHSGSSKQEVDGSLSSNTEADPSEVADKPNERYSTQETESVSD